MIFKRFYIIIIIRILLILLSNIVLAYLLSGTGHLVSISILAVLIAIQTWSLIYYVNRTNRRLSVFFDSIRHSDFSATFSGLNAGKGLDILDKAFNEVVKEFKKSRAEKEENYHYLQTVVQHISIGILCYDVQGNIDLSNNAVRRILHTNKLENLNDLAAIKDDLPGTLMKLRAGDKILVKIIIDDELKQLSFYATQFRMRNKDFTLVAFQDIYAELEEKEVESWQKLIRVLTHEIMNSITPISSLIQTVNNMLFDTEGNQIKLKPLDTEDVENIKQALDTVHNRSQGLLNFVDVYRNLTRIPKPNFRYFKIKECFERVSLLLSPQIDEHKITCKQNVYPAGLMVTADPDLLDQVIINLVLNSIDAVKDTQNPEITMVAYINRNNKTTVEVIDNGCGIKQDIIDKIFFPFFTSKKQGSGIGLSLARQIMHLHKGNIMVKSRPGEGSVFTLVF